MADDQPEAWVAEHRDGPITFDVVEARAQALARALARGRTPALPQVSDIDTLRWAISQWLPSGVAPEDPAVSPVLADLAGPPPTVVHRCERGMVHGFIQNLDLVPPGSRARNRALARRRRTAPLRREIDVNRASEVAKDAVDVLPVKIARASDGRLRAGRCRDVLGDPPALAT